MTGATGHCDLVRQLAPRSMRPNPSIEALDQSSIMRIARIAILLLLSVLAMHVWANDLLWEKLRTEANLVVLMRHTQPQAVIRSLGTQAEIAGVNRC